MDFLVPDNLNPEQLDFLKRSLALKPFAPLAVQADFEVFFKQPIGGSVIQRVSMDYKEEIIQLRQEIYENETSLIPIANSYNILALAQSRIEHLLKTPKTVRQLRRLKADGTEYFEDEKEIDDTHLEKWATIAQNERFNTLKLEIAKIVNAIDKSRLPKTGFKPISINTGFQESEEESANT